MEDQANILSKTPVKKTIQRSNGESNQPGGAIQAMRPSTLASLGLGNVLDIFRNGKLPVSTADMVDEVFGRKNERGAMIITGASGIVGAGKVMQFASRLLPYNVPIIALDLPGAQDGLQHQFQGLIQSFGQEAANAIMKNIIRLNYDGHSLPDTLKKYNPKFLLEAIPEKLELKQAHYRLFRQSFPDIPIWSVTSGFPSSQLGVGIAHPSFPHEINKVFEIVEPYPSSHTRLLWSLGLIPIQVSDHWSFVLDVFFCGLMQASLQFCRRTSMPFWKADKYIRQLIGPNPYRAHDVIGAKGSNFLTWSCLHHLGEAYGPLFIPEEALVERKESGQAWYPPDHFRPLVNWSLEGEEYEELRSIVFGALFQMTSIMLHERRADPTSMNAIGELCAQFTRGLLAHARQEGVEKINGTVKAYHQLVPAAAETEWYPDEFKKMNTPAWQQLYVNAEHDGKAGVITISRESYNGDVDAELNRAIDWLSEQKIDRVILTSDFHLSTQLIGADTNEFYPALTDIKEGERIALAWSKTARRLHHEFEISLGFISGKRCMGGMLELMMHCHYLFAAEEVVLAMPEVTLPVLPGMESCHWPFRKANNTNRKYLLHMLLEGKPVKAKDAVGWLVDYTGTTETTLQKAWQVMENGTSALPMRAFEEKPIKEIQIAEVNLPHHDGPLQEARDAIAGCIAESCNAPLAEAIAIQARHSARFMISQPCRKGKIGSEYDKLMRN